MYNVLLGNFLVRRVRSAGAVTHVRLGIPAAGGGWRSEEWAERERLERLTLVCDGAAASSRWGWSGGVSTHDGRHVQRDEVVDGVHVSWLVIGTRSTCP